jgi:hypothetical protein
MAATGTNTTRQTADDKTITGEFLGYRTRVNISELKGSTIVSRATNVTNVHAAQRRAATDIYAFTQRTKASTREERQRAMKAIHRHIPRNFRIDSKQAL